MLGVPFADFIAPGLIVMAMMQNAFANASFSLLVGKVQGNIVDYLMPPLSTGELIAGLVGASVTSAFLVGFAVWLAMLLWPGVSVELRRPGWCLWFGLMGSLMLGFLGLVDLDLGGEVRPCRGGHQFRGHALVAAQRHFLFGRGAAAQRARRSATPIRSSSSSRAFARASSGSAIRRCCSAASVLIAINLALFAACYALLKSGWKIKN